MTSRNLFFVALVLWLCLFVPLDILSHSFKTLKPIAGVIAVGGVWVSSTVADVLFFGFPKPQAWLTIGIIAFLLCLVLTHPR
jgi:hypothetical protein